MRLPAWLRRPELPIIDEDTARELTAPLTNSAGEREGLVAVLRPNGELVEGFRR